MLTIGQVDMKVLILSSISCQEGRRPTNNRRKDWLSISFVVLMFMTPSFAMPQISWSSLNTALLFLAATPPHQQSLCLQATALLYFKRFYLHHSVMDVDPKDIM